MEKGLEDNRSMVWNNAAPGPDGSEPSKMKQTGVCSLNPPEGAQPADGFTMDFYSQSL